MRIVFFSNVHPNPLAAQKGTFNGALVRALGEQHDVHVVCPISWIERLRAFRTSVPKNTIHLEGSVTASYPIYWYPPTVLRSHFDQFMQWSIQKRLLRELRAFRPDAILSYWAHPDGTVALRTARALGVPAITMVGGSDVLLLSRRGARRRVILNTLRQSDAVITVSEDIAEKLIADDVPEQQVHVVRRGVDRAIFQPGDKAAARRKLGLPLDAEVIVGVGRLVPVKDWPTLIEACGLLQQAGKVPLCCLVGNGPLKGSLQQQIQQLGLTERVLLKGSQPQAALADWYRAADLVVLPSLSEGVPNVLLEAIACGTSFVATRVGGIPEITDPMQHRLVSAGQPRELAAAIRDRLSLRLPETRLRVEPISWGESAGQVTHIIEDCLTARTLHDCLSTTTETASDSRPREAVAARALTQGGVST